jgi:hypothetical protein
VAFDVTLVNSDPTSIQSARATGLIEAESGGAKFDDRPRNDDASLEVSAL